MITVNYTFGNRSILQGGQRKSSKRTCSTVRFTGLSHSPAALPANE